MQTRLAALIRLSVGFLTLLTALTMPSIAAQKGLGALDDQSDVGKVIHAGSVSYDARNQEYSVSGSGSNMWMGSDEYHLVWKRLKGDFILTARAHFVGQGVEAHRKMGWIVLPGLESSAPHVNATVHGDGLTSLQFRRTP